MILTDIITDQIDEALSEVEDFRQKEKFLEELKEAVESRLNNVNENKR